MLPVNLRDEDAATDLGNKIILGMIAMPMNFSDPVDAVWKCKAQVDALKSSPLFFVKKCITDAVFSAIPAEALAEGLLSEGYRSTFMMSNVMGPQEESTMASYALSDLNFTAVHSGGLYCGILSYNRKLRISLILDKLTDGNAYKLKKCLERAFDELKVAVFMAAPNEMDSIERPPAPAVPLSAKLLELAVTLLAVSVPVLVASTRNWV